MTSAPALVQKGEIERLFDAMSSEKGDLVERCRMYAAWTIPALVPAEGGEVSKMITSYVQSGPRLLHSLSNKIVDTMFPTSKPFFSINLSADVEKRLREEIGPEKLSAMKVSVGKESRYMEQYAMSKMGLIAYRPKAVEAAQQLLVSGNVAIRRLPDGSRAVYSIADFGVRRTISGEAYDLVFRDAISYEELPDVAKEHVRRVDPGQYNKVYAGDHRTSKYKLYTRVYRAENGAWLVQQETCGVALPGTSQYSDTDRPFIDLVWSLPRGFNYARGLVEEHANTFHNLNTISEAVFDIANMLADIKWVVGATSMLDVNELNNSRRGSYHAGDGEQIKALVVDKQRELSALMELKQQGELELAKAFLMQSGTVRDAERVTAFEVQLNALELESAFGGLYSRLALAWQQREAQYLIGSLKIPAFQGRMFEVKITTGLENLSREGALQSFRMAVQDLSAMHNIPESVIAAIDPMRVTQFVFSNHGIDFNDFAMTQEQIAQKQQQEMQQQAQLINQEAAAKVATQPDQEG